MKTVETVTAMKDLRRTWSGQVGFVPTMGALHAGHLQLVERARRECERVVVSIFVNPTQFNDPNDLQKYPRTIERDLELLAPFKVDAVFLPQPSEMYADGYLYEVREKDFSKKLCGAHRAGHFEGVLTVVMKLFNIVNPTRAYFGEKDYQQFLLIKGMAKAFYMDTEVVPCPTVREADGLAMSSRNTRLTPEQRAQAPVLPKILKAAESAEQARRRLEEQGFRVDYVEDYENRRFAAAFLGDVRLIDNVER